MDEKISGILDKVEKRNFNLNEEIKNLEKIKKLREKSYGFTDSKDEDDLDSLIRQKKISTIIFWKSINV